MMVDGERQWVTYEHFPDDDGDFAACGEAFALTGLESVGEVGAGQGRLMKVRDVVDFGVTWLRSNRPAPNP